MDRVFGQGGDFLGKSNGRGFDSRLNCEAGLWGKSILPKKALYKMGILVHSALRSNLSRVLVGISLND